jgi:hypothetical protein
MFSSVDIKYTLDLTTPENSYTCFISSTKVFEVSSVCDAIVKYAKKEKKKNIIQQNATKIYIIESSDANKIIDTICEECAEI